MSPLISVVSFAARGSLRIGLLARRPVLRLSEGDGDPQASVSPVASETAPRINPAEWPILIVDDEADIRTALRDLLEDEGYLVSEAVDGMEGLTLIRTSAQPLIVLLDYKMPRMNGAEMLQACLADSHLVGRHAFIFVTANLPAFSPEFLQLVEAAAIPVVQKPFTISVILDEIARAIARLPAPPERPTA